MNDIYSDVTVHLGELLATEDLTRLERALETERGVSRARTRAHAGQPWIVNFDPSTSTALRALRAMRTRRYATGS